MSQPAEPTHLQTLLVRTALGDRADALSPGEIEALAAEFMRAGTHAVLARLGSAHEAASAMAHARALGRVARDRVATETTPLSGPTFVEPEFTAAHAAVEEHRDALSARPEVVGVGPGFRRRDGVQTEERCVVVYVQRKRTPAQLRRSRTPPIASELRTADGTRVPTDVVALGRLRRHASAGGSVGRVGRIRHGTIGAFVDDLAQGGRAALTAMHVMGQSVATGDPFVSPAHQQPGSTGLGGFRRGTMDRIDAAVLGVERASSLDNSLPGIGLIRGFRPVSVPGDYDRAVSMFGAQTRQTVSGHIVEPLIHLPDDRLESAILARIPSTEGDSGAALVDSNNLVLGFLVGEIGPPDAPLRVFTPATLVLQLLACDLPPPGPNP
ncbi:MAG TPA: hypothetical protein VFX98_18445 [Longimicrobiaceae bacterium]|nr:hypothetical protein [Longimicrobiaceae bacterium]